MKHRIFGLIGYPLSHSFSPKYFAKKFQLENIQDAAYKLFPLKNINDFPELLKANSPLCGLNVTIPYKETIIPFLDELDETARQVGAVNTIKIKAKSEKNKKKRNSTHELIGYNTDAAGFENSLKNYLQPHHKKALILGSGGASKAVAYILTKLKIDFLFVSRNLNNACAKNIITYNQIDASTIQSHLLIINTTPMGMMPAAELCPSLPYKQLTSRHLLFDLIYNPPETLFMKKGKEKGAAIVNGMEMLQLQAEESWKIWNNNFKRFLLSVALILYTAFSFSQQEKIKELELKLPLIKDNSLRFAALDSLSGLYEDVNMETALKYADEALAVATKIPDQRKIFEMQYTIARIYFSLRDLNKAEAFHLLSIKGKEAQFGTELSKEEKLSLARSHNNIGNVYYAMANYSRCMESFYKALNLREQVGDKKMIYLTLNNIGLVNIALKNDSKALECFHRTLSLMDETDSTGKKIGQDLPKANTLHNIGLLYYNKNLYDSALHYYSKALELRKKVNNAGSIAESYNNIGLVYYETQHKKEALDYYMKAMELFKEINDKYSLAAAYSNLGLVYSEMNHYDKALDFFNKGLKISTEINAREWVKDNSLGIANVYAKKNDFKNAFEHYKIFSQTKDSIYSEESLRQMHEMEAKYETAQKQKQIEIQNLQLIQQELEINKKQIVIYAVSLGLTLMLILAFVIYRGYSQKKKLNRQLTAQNIIIEQKNKDITDSIEYAKTLQDAILPDMENIKQILPGSFVFFRPRDIVSGDFYWVAQAPLPSPSGGGTLIAACDCTGHGVPGAFVSMVCNNLLNEIVNHKGISQPGDILTQVNQGVSETFRKEGRKSKANDGMDIALIRLDEMKLQYAGAINSGLLVRNNKPIELTADKMPIGGFTPTDFKFKNNEIVLEKNDAVYIFSDGFHDQFGGTKGKKFMYRGFKELLVKISVFPAEQQKQELEGAFNNWLGDHQQIDDVLVIGIKV